MGESGIEGIEDLVGELLALPPEQFTEARNAAAKELRADGRRAEADALKGLPRPAVSLWALNGVAREQPALLEEFAAAAAALRKAYSDGGDIRAASAPERAAEGRVATAAAELVRRAGGRTSETVLRGISQTLHAAAADAAVAEALQRGILAREPEAPSIDALLGTLPPAPAGRGPTTEAGGDAGRAGPGRGEAEDDAEVGDDRGEAAREREEARRELRSKLADARSDAEAARAEARSADEAARAARAEWERAQRRADAARERADEATARAEDAKSALDEL